MQKQLLRETYLEKRDVLSKEHLIPIDEKISSALFSSQEYQYAQVIFVYVSIENEIDTSGIIKQALSDKKTVCVPRMAKNRQMDAVPIEDISDLVRMVWGIPEPALEAPTIEIEKIDLIIVPCLSVDKNCNRLGYGGGFYDVFLSKAKQSCKNIALQRSEFIHPELLPSEEFDIAIDCVLTENGFIYRR